MTNYKTPTHQNLAVWCRRLGVEVSNLDLAATMADKVYNGPSRRGVFYTIAMKVLRSEVDPLYTLEYRNFVAVAMSNTLYQIVVLNADPTKVRVLFTEAMLALVNKTGSSTVLSEIRALNLIGSYTEYASNWVSGGVQARLKERTAPSIANMILQKVRR